jgi:hypothetical protein
MELERATQKGKDWTTIVLACGLALTLVVLAVSVLWGVINNRGELSEAGTRVLTVAISGVVGILGFRMGVSVGKHDGGTVGQGSDR